MTNLQLFLNTLNSNLYDLAQVTALDRLSRLSRSYQRELLVKREDQQEIFSFKIRGAYNKIKNLPAQQRSAGVITASAGNHAQGVARSAHKLGLPAHIVMPLTTPENKVRSVRAWGYDPIIVGDNFDEAYQHACQLQQELGLSYIPPFNDLDVIAGQGSVAMEILNQCSEPIEAVFIPVGGGGLIAGMANYIKTLRPEIKIVGVEPQESASMAAAIEAGQPVDIREVGLFADGVAVRQVGEHSYRVAHPCIDMMLQVSTDDICAAIKDTFDDTRVLSEPSGALALAGMKQYLERGLSSGSGCLICINSGANTDFDRLRYIAERAEIGERREALFSVSIPERPGSFKQFCRTLGKRAVSEFNYRYSDPSDARIFVGVKIQSQQDKATILQLLAAHELPAEDISDDELAKDHLRYMVGGKAPVSDELLYSFSFPERPGALLKFLESLSGKWNISLFHYRNHGAAWNSVLVGLQVPEAERSELESALRNLNYPFREESDNSSYLHFLR